MPIVVYEAYCPWCGELHYIQEHEIAHIDKAIKECGNCNKPFQYNVNVEIQLKPTPIAGNCVSGNCED